VNGVGELEVEFRDARVSVDDRLQMDQLVREEHSRKRQHQHSVSPQLQHSAENHRMVNDRVQ